MKTPRQSRIALACSAFLSTSPAYSQVTSAPVNEVGICSYAQDDVLTKHGEWRSFLRELQDERSRDQAVNQYLLRTDASNWIAQISIKFFAQWLADAEFKAWDAEIEGLYGEEDASDQLRERTVSTANQVREKGLQGYLQKQEPLFRELQQHIEQDVLAKNLRATNPEAVAQFERQYGAATLRHVERFESVLQQKIMMKAIGRVALVKDLWEQVIAPGRKLIALMENDISEQKRIEQRELAALLRRSELLADFETARMFMKRACSVSVDVDARVTHTRTDLYVEEGDCIRVRVHPESRIVWTRYQNRDIVSGPDGSSLKKLFGPNPPPSMQGMSIILGLNARPMPEEDPGALIATIEPEVADDEATYEDTSGGSWFYIGAGTTLNAPASGELVFGVNDAHTANNSGHFLITAYRTTPLVELEESAGDIPCGIAR